MEQNFFSVFIEIPKGSGNKYEYDEALGKIKLDFVLQNGLKFPYNYGFILGTRGGDGDNLDAIIFSTNPLDVGIVAECKIIGVQEVIDRGEKDDKILCVPICDPMAEILYNVEDVSGELRKSIEDFLKELARQKNKVMEIKAWKGKEEAIKEINNSLQ